MDNLIIASVAAFLSAIIGAMGMGGGSILLIYLTTFVGINQLAAQGINLLFFIPIAALSLLIHTKNGLVSWKTALPAIPAGLLGVFGGTMLAGWLGDDLLHKLFALFLVLIGIRELFRKAPCKEEE